MKRGTQFLSCLALLVMLSLGATAQGKIKPWEKFDFSKHKIAHEQIKELSLLELKYLRGLVFARHGRVFGEETIQKYLKSLSWYKPDPKYHVSMLNATERHNMDVIKDAEARRHKTVEAGDLEYYQNKIIPKEKLGKYSLLQLRIMRGEIEARRGKRFKDEPWLQEYFDERYWYRPRDDYSPQKLSAAERQNLRTLAALENQARNLRLAPCDMGKYRNQLITFSLLNGLSLWEVRVLRNEIFARHGYVFRTAWLKEYFAGQSWYRPKSSAQPQLSKTEEQNLKVILAYEDRLHRELSTKPVSEKLLKNLSAEDARRLRNEIFARRGFTFGDKRLQRYFASFDWYKPNPKFSSNSLSSIEKKNAGVILAYEKQLSSVLRQTAA